jgi:Pentapeptide repeats (9 copies)
MKELDSDFFINPGVNIDQSNGELTVIAKLSKEQLKGRWTTAQGKNTLRRWKANDFRRDTLDHLVGKYYDHTDIRGINISKEILKNVDLSNIDLYAANLSGTIFERCNLTESWLSETDISGAIFTFSDMTKVFLDNVNFDTRTRFIGIDLKSINFTLAALLEELVIGQQKIEHLERRNPYFTKFLKWTCDYGRSFRRFLLCCISVIFLFSLMYYLIPNAVNSNDFLIVFIFLH